MHLALSNYNTNSNNTKKCYNTSDNKVCNSTTTSQKASVSCYQAVVTRQAEGNDTKNTFSYTNTTTDMIIEDSLKCVNKRSTATRLTESYKLKLTKTILRG